MSRTLRRPGMESTASFGGAVTLCTAGMLGLLHVILSANVIRTRGATGVTTGVGAEDSLLARRVRAHANNAEHAPIFVLLLGLVEGKARSGAMNDYVAPGSGLGMFVPALAVMFVTGRIMHAVTFSTLRKSVVGRVGGTALTLTCISAASLAALATTIFS
ncbi:hypothetical protein FVE85_8630 [Porphyridium purpureum]|uniref:MAPEG family protein n=1 Tax=Porphyridium purpureum TaxID=35688 RepID=A0A5J4YPQ2_PORPP|nr:hypothetical protein FVE85_8630 [Porphyridium purpureum]|eukprot:POR5160..scf296_7